VPKQLRTAPAFRGHLGNRRGCCWCTRSTVGSSRSIVEIETNCGSAPRRLRGDPTSIINASANHLIPLARSRGEEFNNGREKNFGLTD
jgi:hypothetical protein